MQKFILLTLTLYLLGSCAEPSGKKIEELDEQLIRLEQEVMAIHDEAMVRLEEINNSTKKLQSKLEAGGLTHDDSIALAAGRDKLVLADSLMWEWMYAFKKPEMDTKEKKEEGLSYLQDEREKITHVKETMFQSLALADSLLQTNQN